MTNVARFSLRYLMIVYQDPSGFGVNEPNGSRSSCESGKALLGIEIGVDMVSLAMASAVC